MFIPGPFLRHNWVCITGELYRHFRKTGLSPGFAYKACGELKCLSLAAFFISVRYGFALSISKIQIEHSSTKLAVKLTGKLKWRVKALLLLSYNGS